MSRLNRNRISKKMKAHILVHIAAIRSWVKMEQEGKNEFFLAGFEFTSDEAVLSHFCLDHLVNTSDYYNLESGKLNHKLPQMVEYSLINAGEYDYFMINEKNNWFLNQNNGIIN